MRKISVNVDHRNRVFVVWHDTYTSGTLTFTPDEAIAIGHMGRMAEMRASETETTDRVPDNGDGVQEPL